MLEIEFANAGVEISLVLLLLLGLMVGVLSGFFGVGGGFLITGGLIVFGVPTPFAVGTGLTLIMGSSIINTLNHRHLGHVDFKLGLILVSGTIPALFLAEWLINSLEAAGLAGPVIRYVYVVVLAVLGLFIVYDFLRTRRATVAQVGEITTARLAQRVQSLKIPPHSITIPGYRRVPTYVSFPASGIDRISVFIPFTVGIGAGLFAGLLGAGGGTVLMPVLIFVLGIPTTIAIGTDLFQIIITGSMGTFIKSFNNHVDPVMVVIMLSSASLGSQLGTAATRYVAASRIRILFGVTVLSGSVAVAMEQASRASWGGEALSTAASVLLLGFAGVICIMIAVMMVVAKRGAGGKQAVGRLETRNTHEAGD